MSDESPAFPRPQRRGRIETIEVPSQRRCCVNLSPGLSAGGGLKLAIGGVATVSQHLSPGLSAGGGLKRVVDDQVRRGRRAFPRPQRRGRIETRRMRLKTLASARFPPASAPGAD